METNKNIIIGCGTGRNGTKSLADLLGQCKKISASHEFRNRNGFPHRLSWQFKKEEIDSRLCWIEKYSSNFIADVASYYLNYINYLVKNVKNLKIIYLHRPTNEVITSFMRITHHKDEKDTNHWLSHTHKDFKEGKYRKVTWDKCFPKYKKVKNKKRAIKRYCDVYEQKMKKYINKYPNKIFPIELRFFGSKTIQKAMYNFIGIPKKDRVYKNVWSNKKRKNENI